MPRPGIEIRTLGSQIEHTTTRLKAPDRLDWSVMRVIYIFTHLFGRSVTLLHPTIKQLYEMFRNCGCCFFYSVAIAPPLGSNGNHPGTRHQCCSRRKICEEISSGVPRSEIELRTLGSQSEHTTTRLKGPDQLDLSLCTLYIFTYIDCSTTLHIYM